MLAIYITTELQWPAEYKEITLKSKTMFLSSYRASKNTVVYITGLALLFVQEYQVELFLLAY